MIGKKKSLNFIMWMTKQGKLLLCDNMRGSNSITILTKIFYKFNACKCFNYWIPYTVLSKTIL